MSKKILNDTKKLHNELISLYLDLNEQNKNKFKRSLPFQELIFDRFKRSKNEGFHKSVSIDQDCYIYGKPTINKNTWIGPYTILDGSGGLKIGENCSISSGVHIYTHHTVFRRIEKKFNKVSRSDVSIGKNCYIGPQSIIASGTKIGSNSIIASNSFVSGKFPNRSFIAGNPGEKKGIVEFNSKGEMKISPIKTNLEKTIMSIEKRIKKLESK